MALTIVVFGWWKLSSLSFRFGDENVYFYMTRAILGGLIPYRDFFLADPPFFIYLLSGFKAIIGSHLILFKTIPVIFDSLSAVLIYMILKKRKINFAFLGPVFYLFSFTVLSTSDYVTGAEVMIALVLLALLSDEYGKPWFSGIFWALACLSKLYAAPALIGFLIYKIYKKEYPELLRVVVGGLITTLIVMLPFFIIAPHQTLYDLITHQFRRPVGINKWNVFGVFVGFEWFLVLLAVIGAFITKNKSWALSFGLSLLFFLTYRDIYYLYLHLLIPFLVLLGLETINFIREKNFESAWALVLVYILISLYPIFSYSSIYAPQGIFERPEEVARALIDAPEKFPIFGVQEVTPLAGLMSGKKIFENIIDSNVQNFASGTHNKDKISADAEKTGIYLITRAAEYPEQNIYEPAVDSYFNLEIFKNSCTRYKSFDRTVPGDPLNKVVIYKCYKSSS